MRLGSEGPRPAQVNVVVVRGQNEDELPAFVELTRHRPVNVRFIEYMPFDGNVWSDAKLVPYRAMQGAVSAAFPQACTQAPCTSQQCQPAPAGTCDVTAYM